MTKFRVDDEEFDALAGDNNSGLSHEAKLIYLLAIRPYMDYETGLAGYKRVISYQSIREVIEYAPSKGSTRPAKRYTKEAIRAFLGELERRGLVVWIKNEDRGLFFNCISAARDILPKNMNNPRTTPEQPHGINPKNNPMNNPEEPHEHLASGHSEQHHEQPEEQPHSGEAPYSKSNTPPVSGSPYINTPPVTRVRACDPTQFEQEGEDTPQPNDGMPACIPRMEWDRYRKWRDESGKPMTIGQIQACWQELASMDKDGYDPGKVLLRATGGGLLTFDRRPETKKAPTTGKSASGPSSASKNETKRGNYAHNESYGANQQNSGADQGARKLPAVELM